MRLTDYADRYVTRSGGSAGYRHQMRVLTSRLPWRVQDLSPDLIDGYLTAALTKLSPITVHAHRRMLQTLLRAAVADGLVDECTRRIRKVKYRLPVPRAWSREELRKLLSVAAKMPGGTQKRRCPYSVLMPAWVQVGYSTGLRLGDLIRVEHDQIRGNKLALTINKTGRVHVCVLDDAALESIRALPVYGKKIFGDIISGVQVIRVMRRLVKRAGLTGSTKFLRRSSATMAEIAGMSATRHLGHMTAGLAQAHYVDPVLLASERQPIPPILPPSLEPYAPEPGERRRTG